jgi:hypothetical protein
MVHFGIFYRKIWYFTAIWYPLRPKGMFCGRLVYVSPILVYFINKESGNPGHHDRKWNWVT